MNRLSTLLGSLALCLAGPALPAEDFGPLLKTTQATWAEKRHIGVICDFQASRAEVMALARAAGEGARITVADARRTELAGSAAQILAHRDADFLVLLPGDRMFKDGSFGASLAISRLGLRGIPAVGTSPAAVRQGAVFSIGDRTEGELLVTDRLIGTVDVLLPGRATLARKAALVLREEGMATVSVHTAR